MGGVLTISREASFPGRRDQVRYARAFVARFLDGHPAAGDAVLLVRQTLASVAERAKQGGYYSGARTDIINAHADLRAALDMLVKAAGPDISGIDRLAELMP